MKEKLIITWKDFYKDIAKFRLPFSLSIPVVKVYGVPKGGMIVAGFMCSHYVRYQMVTSPNEADVIIDDIEDSGETRRYYENRFPLVPFRALYQAKDHEGKWLVFPWEHDHPSGEESIEGNITRILEYIGDNPSRDGLKDTPRRVIKSYKELFSGYGKDPREIFTVFDGPDQKYDSMVLLKDIELYSTCEHHMLPFYGKAHVAYIPDGGKIVGISKLARLVDLFARRLQVQERICEQVTETLMQHLQPKGAACVIEATHMCMCARGVGKQHSSMVSSSLKGVFRTELAVREEFMNLIAKH